MIETVIMIALYSFSISMILWSLYSLGARTRKTKRIKAAIEKAYGPSKIYYIPSYGELSAFPNDTIYYVKVSTRGSNGRQLGTEQLIERTIAALDKKKAYWDAHYAYMQVLDEKIQALTQQEDVLDELEEIFPCIKAATKSPCSCVGTSVSLSHVVMHLNDHHGWTREQIADWVETLDVDIEAKNAA